MTSSTSVHWPETIVSYPSSALEIRVPDWNRVTFESLPGFSESGRFFGMERSSFTRHWSASDHPLHVLTIGDFQTSFRLQDFSLATLAEIHALTHQQKRHLTLDFQLFQDQTLASLVDAIPALAGKNAASIEPVRDLLIAAKTEIVLETTTLEEVFQIDPSLGDINFSSLDLTAYTVSSIPGGMETPISQFDGWEEAPLFAFPLLMQTPWAAFNAPPTANGEIGVFLNDTDEAVATTLSGTRAGTVDCSDCEFTVVESVAGLTKWEHGSSRISSGSDAFPTSLEPAGLFPFGSGFKVVIRDEREGEIATDLYFQVCRHEEIVVCSPYAIGPVPFMAYQLGEGMVLGELQFTAAPVTAAIPVLPTEEEGQNHREPPVLLLAVVVLFVCGAWVVNVWQQRRQQQS